jgi:hypothetical protein
MVLSAVPNPAFELAGITVGAVGMRFWRFMLAVLIGKNVRGLLLVPGRHNEPSAGPNLIMKPPSLALGGKKIDVQIGHPLWLTGVDTGTRIQAHKERLRLTDSAPAPRGHCPSGGTHRSNQQGGTKVCTQGGKS